MNLGDTNANVYFDGSRVLTSKRVPDRILCKILQKFQSGELVSCDLCDDLIWNSELPEIVLVPTLCIYLIKVLQQ